MQYILTKEEYEDLVPKAKYNAEKEKVEELNKQVLQYSGFYCWRDKNDDFGVCDFCPITKTCTKPHRYSK